MASSPTRPDQNRAGSEKRKAVFQSLLDKRRAERELIFPLRRVDLLAKDGVFDLEEALRRLRRRGTTPVGVALLDQQAVGGVGNVYKSEGLFRRRLDPFATIDAIDAIDGRDGPAGRDSLRQLLVELRALLQLNVAMSGAPTRTTTLRTAVDDDDALVPRATGPLAVYGRAGEACFACGTTIERALQGETRRATYWCPRCQPTLLWPRP